MSIIRFSHVKDTLSVTDPAGNLVEADYRLRNRQGSLGAFLRPRDGAAEPSATEKAAVLADLRKQSRLLLRHLEAELGVAAGKLGAGSPVVVMVHGFLFDPRMQVSRDPAGTDNPHGRVFHFQDTGEDSEIRAHTTGWPLQLGFAEEDGGANGLAVAFGWLSQPGFASSLMERFQNFYARAYDNGRDAAWSLVCVLQAMADRIAGDSAPPRPIDLLCHSLGSAVVVRAIAIAAKYEMPLVARLGRVIVLGGSEYTGEANLMYRRVAAMQAAGTLAPDAGPHFYNVVSRENDVLDTLAENFGPKSFFSSSQVIGHNGLEAAPQQPRWIDLQIDSGALRTWMATYRNLRVSGDQPGHVWDHWYYYTYRNNMALYRAILRDRSQWDLALLREQKIAEGVAVGAFGD